MSSHGEGAVRISWVKAHVGISGNARANEAAKAGAAKDFGGGIT